MLWLQLQQAWPHGKATVGMTFFPAVTVAKWHVFPECAWQGTQEDMLL